MKKILLWILPGCLIAAAYFGYRKYQQYLGHQQWLEFQANISDTASPNVFKDSIYIPYQDDYRKIHVYLPPDYATDTAKYYPVMYFMDGNSCFNDLENMNYEWQIDEIMDTAHLNGQATAIVIGIESAEDRDAEYTPFINEDNPEAHGDRYTEWFAEEFKTWADTTFRTQREATSTTIGGISRSGMMAYYMLMARPDVFGNAIIQSPAMWVDEDRLLGLQLSRAQLADKKIFISVGEYEGRIMIPNAKNIHDKFKAQGLPEDRLQFNIMEGRGHDHLGWRESFALAYPFLFE